jgi:hypothetical protein
MDSFTYIQKLADIHQRLVSVERSQKAEISEKNDEGEEVASQLEKIATIDPLLTQCAVIVGDPVQTAAMAKFAEGKMSYAEMRGLCG